MLLLALFILKLCPFFQKIGKIYETKKYGLSCAKTSWLAAHYGIKWLYFTKYPTLFVILLYNANDYVYRHVCLHCINILIASLEKYKHNKI